MAKLDQLMTKTQQIDVETLLAEIEIEEEDIPLNGTCPYANHCETRRRRLPTYRPEVPCHWVAWGDWRCCPIFKSNNLKERR